ncbi:MAG: hypothetical protein OEY37_01375 [Gammaproteobacteria bacterium]|nr:hypothetical protein [Gammaproteobacteria bacterium]
MSTASWDHGRIGLPARTSPRQSAEDSLASRIALADLLSELPNIVTKETSADTLARDFDIYVGWRKADWIRNASRSQLLCRISAGEIFVYGLGDDEANEIISRGWGEASPGCVHVFPPCGEDDLQQCWRILQHAYHSVSARVMTAVRVASTLPSFSRTRLQ